ncbi:MAG: FixH family protein [Hyphomonadaceae bacterium]|nr:FixH family protein [Hyphomonadaceae bacterium]
MSARSGPGPLRGVHVWSALAAFFLLVIAVNATFITLALRTFPGEDVRRSYLQGLHYNETLADRRAQAKLGWRASAILSTGASGPLVEVRIRDRDGAPLSDLELSGVLRRPATANADAQLAFVALGDGLYIAPAPSLAPGQWRLRAQARRRNGERFDLERSLQWRLP